MMKVVKTIFSGIKYFFETIWLGLYYLCLIVSKGFFFYLYCLFCCIGFVFRFRFIDRIKDWLRNCQKSPIPFLAVSLIVLFGTFFYVYLYSANNKLAHIPENFDDDSIKSNIVRGKGGGSGQDGSSDYSFDDNLYRKYGATSLENIDISSIRAEHPEVVAWLVVDSTNINYPITQSSDNDYYLYHDINGTSKISGWPFMDFRNSSAMTDQNTIFYGHNLLNRTAFGSVANIFTEEWFNNSTHRIIVITENGRYIYTIFSNYYIDPEVYYLQTNFSSDTSYLKFLKTLKERSVFDYGVELSASDQIITLSTCTDDNTGRKVVHAKLESKS